MIRKMATVNKFGLMGANMKESGEEIKQMDKVG